MTIISLQRTILITLTLVASLIASPAFAEPGPPFQIGQPNPDAPPELAQFAFMLGEFSRRERLRNRDGTWGPWQAGEWNGRYFMNGLGIIDTARNYATGVVAANMRVYDPAAAKWKVTWLKLPDYAMLNAEGRKEGDKMVLVNPATNDRWVFSDITDNGYTWTLHVLYQDQYIPVREIQTTRKVEPR
jgi:hypothetical protein